MYTVTRELSFSYGHRLLQHEGKCGRIHGHNGRLRVTLASEKLDPAGMVVDFFDIKKALSGWIDGTLDHRLILQHEDPAVAALQGIGEAIVVVDFPPTSENLARHILEHLRKAGLPVVEVNLEETDNCSASYRAPGEGLSH